MCLKQILILKVGEIMHHIEDLFDVVSSAMGLRLLANV
jgi:hypothetical protein